MDQSGNASQPNCTSGKRRHWLSVAAETETTRTPPILMSNRAHSGVRLGIQTDHEPAQILPCRETSSKTGRRGRLAHTAGKL